MTFRQEAKDELMERLRAGKKVNRLDLRDLIESDLAGPRCRDAEKEVSLILASGFETNDSLDLARLRNAYCERLIAEWVDGCVDEVEELAVEMARDYAESQRAGHYA